MKSGKFSDALGEIDISYVEEVVNYKAASKQKRNLWKAMAACAAVILFVISIFPLLKREEEVDGFVLVAYAAENNTIVENELQEGNRVPISFFETQKGLKGFVFAYSKSNPKDVSSISVMTEGEFPGVIDEIVGLELDKEKNYTLYVFPSPSLTTAVRNLSAIPCATKVVSVNSSPGATGITPWSIMM